MTENYIIPRPEMPTCPIRISMPGFKHGNLPSSFGKIGFFKSEPLPFERYLEAFNMVQNEIQRGNSYLLNLTFPTRMKIDCSIEEIFAMAKSPYKLLMPERFVVFSPEIFVRIQNGMISSFPMKGTIDASIPGADEIILNDEKETAEHYTIVDLIRNDLNSVSKNVMVKRFRYIDRINTHQKNLLQVSSEICGRLEKGFGSRIGEILFDLLPAGSVTGAPKKKTVEIIRRAEGYDRGFYTGIFGYFDGENLDSAVMIRFIEQDADGRLYYKSGGGITALSDAENEYGELIDKVYVPVN